MTSRATTNTTTITMTHTTTLPAAIAAMLVTVVLTGCGAGDATTSALGGEWTAERDTAGDTVVVRTVSGSVWGGEARLEPETTIGVLEGESEYILGSVVGLTVDADGSIYVYDRQVPALRKYGPDGRHVATFGGHGGGPGEYEDSDGGIAVLSDGRVLLRDPGNARMNVYSSEGEPLDHWRIRGGYYTPTPTVVDAADHAYAPMFGDIDGMLEFSPTGEVLDTILEPEWDHDSPTLRAEGDRVRTARNVPFAPRVLTAFSPLGYYASGVNTRYAVHLMRPDSPVLRLGRVVEPVPVAAGERAYEEHDVRDAMRGVDPNWRWDGPSIPETKPPFQNLFVGRDGRIWVWLHRSGEPVPESESAGDDEDPDAPRAWREPVVFDVFEPDGRYLGRVRAPDDFRTYPRPVFGRDHVWAVVRDDLGVQSVVRFRIAGPDAAER